MAKKKSKRVNFSKYKPIHDRGFNPAYMEQLQDSLIARNYNEPQRLAFLSTALHESGGDPKAVAKGKDKNGKSVKFSGLYQWGDDRFPNSWNLGDQIHYALESAESKDTKASWSHGGSGIPKINNALEGREAFWNSKDPYEATLYFNKGYVRPAEEQARINRAEEAANMAKNLFNNGGYVYDSNYGVSDLTKSPILGGMMAARTGQPIFDYNLEKISDVPIIDTTNNISSNYFSDPSSIARPTYKTPNSTLLDKIDVKVGGKSLAEGPLTNQELGIKPKTDWNSIASVASAAMPVVDSVINPKKNTTTAGNIMQGIGGAVSMINPVVGLAIQGAGMLTNAAFGSNIDDSKVKAYETQADAVASTTFGGSTNEQLLSQYQAMTPLDTLSKEDIGSEGWFSNKATNKVNELNREREAANNRMLANFDLAVNNLEQQNLMYDMANYAKYGGSLFNEFSNGITKINEGGSHEENPMEGIQVGVDPEGIPNLVEEGEVIFNDYVFSNRLVVPDKVRTKYKLRDTKDLSFADAAKDIQKMSEEMPNDPIVKRTMETQMQELMMEQEQVRMKKDKNKRKNRFDKGGIMSPLEYIEPALSIGQGVQSLFIEPDYSLLNAYDDAINAANIKVSSSPVKTNMRYTPMDTRGLLSEASANRAATNRALMNTSGANPAIARTALTNADYNYNTQLGKLWRSIEEAEYNRQLGFEQFRTNLENANKARDLQAQSFTADILAKQAGLRGDYANRQLAIDDDTSAVISGNIDAAKQSLSGLARQSTYADWVKMMQDNGVLVGPDGSMVKLKKEAKNGGKIKRRRRLS